MGRDVLTETSWARPSAILYILNIRATQFDVIMSEIDKDGGGDVDVDEFSAWLFAPSSEPWLDKSVSMIRDPCHDQGLRRDSARFDPMVRKLLEGFWRVCDRDGSGSIDLEEPALPPLEFVRRDERRGDAKGGLARAS